MEALHRSNAESADQVVREIEKNSGGVRASAETYTIRCKGNGEILMSTQENVQIVKDFFAAMGSGDRQALLALSFRFLPPGYTLSEGRTSCRDFALQFRR